MKFKKGNILNIAGYYWIFDKYDRTFEYNIIIKPDTKFTIKPNKVEVNMSLVNYQYYSSKILIRMLDL